MTKPLHTSLSLNRRRMLLLMAAAGTATASGLAGPLMAANEKKQQGYGPDVDMNNPEVTWDKILTEDQLKTLTILGDIIIPADEKSPAASALDIADFVNEWVSAPYPEQQDDRKYVLDGLKWLDKQASAQSQHSSFLMLDYPEQVAVFDKLATSVQDGSAARPQEKFFERLVYIVAGGFYTTEEGMADMGYVGNVALEEFNGPPAEIKKILGL